MLSLKSTLFKGVLTFKGLLGRLKWHILNTLAWILTGRGGMGVVVVEEGKIKPWTEETE